MSEPIRMCCSGHFQSCDELEKHASETWKRGESEGYHRGVRDAAQALLKLQRFVRAVVSKLSYSPRWPCMDCGRPNADAPLRIVGFAYREDGKRPTEVKHWSGCHVCNNEVLVTEAKKLLEGL